MINEGDMLSIYIGVASTIFIVYAVTLFFFLLEQLKIINALNVKNEAYVTNKAFVWLQIIPILGWVMFWFFISRIENQYNQYKLENQDINNQLPEYKMRYGGLMIVFTIIQIIFNLLNNDIAAVFSIGYLIVFILFWINIYDIRKTVNNIKLEKLNNQISKI